VLTSTWEAETSTIWLSCPTSSFALAVDVLPTWMVTGMLVDLKPLEETCTL
jgi:hypothetical protein